MEEIARLSYKKEPIRKVDIEVRPSPIHRYGVFALKDVVFNEVIEECPVIFCRASVFSKEKAIYDRIFYWDGKCEVLALGYGSIYNHSDEPNADFDLDTENQLIRITALKPITAGTEILICYGDDWFASRLPEPVTQPSLLTRFFNVFSGTFRFVVVLFILLLLSRIFPSGFYS